MEQGQTKTSPKAVSRKAPSSSVDKENFAPEPAPRNPEKKREVSFVFRWNHGGNEVHVIGDFNNWEESIPLSKNKGDFTGIVELPEGEYQYKFIVDGEWVHDPQKESVENDLGSRNNVLKVTSKDFVACKGRDLFEKAPGLPSSPPGEYTQDVPSYKGATANAIQDTIVNQEEIPLRSDPIALQEVALKPQTLRMFIIAGVEELSRWCSFLPFIFVLFIAILLWRNFSSYE